MKYCRGINNHSGEGSLIDILVVLLFTIETTVDSSSLGYISRSRTSVKSATVQGHYFLRHHRDSSFTSYDSVILDEILSSQNLRLLLPGRRLKPTVHTGSDRLSNVPSLVIFTPMGTIF